MIRLWILGQVPELELSFGRVQAVSDAVGRAGSGTVIEVGLGFSVIVEKDVVRIDG
jgi:hypothetical protein